MNFGFEAITEILEVQETNETVQVLEEYKTCLAEAQKVGDTEAVEFYNEKIAVIEEADKRAKAQELVGTERTEDSNIENNEISFGAAYNPSYYKNKYLDALSDNNGQENATTRKYYKLYLEAKTEDKF